MKVVIFSGGLGARLSDDTEAIPKPMVEIGGRPIIWHIMKLYSHYGFNEFIICLGYKGNMIKEYFLHYFMHNSDISIEMATNTVTILDSSSEAFTVTLVDTGIETKTAGRLRMVKPYINGEDFMLTYGNGLADVDIAALYKFHQSHGKLATVTSIHQETRFGAMELSETGEVVGYTEHARDNHQWVNGGYFVLKPDVFKYIDDDLEHEIWEEKPMERLTADHQLMAFKHQGFWKTMDAQRDKTELENLWKNQHAPWVVWPSN